MDASQIALEMLKLVEENYSLDDVIADYKKALDAVGGSVTISNKPSNVLGKTGGRNVPIVKHDDIKMRLTESMVAQSGSAVTSNMVQF